MKLLFTTLLAVAVFGSAIQVVLTQHQARKTFIELQRLEQARDGLNEEWGRLQLEQSTWATDDRIERVARTRLDMDSPEFNATVLLAE